MGGAGGGVPGVCTHYLLTWWNLGVGERNRQGVGMGYLNFWSALELGFEGGLMYIPLNYHRPKLPIPTFNLPW